MPIADTGSTIVAPCTPPGAGAIAILRLSGPRAFAIAASFLKPVRSLKNPRPRMAYMLSVTDGKKLVDKAVALFYKGPKSYTGEDTVEIFCHGSPYIIRSILNLSIKAGASPAGPGEFTMRAFLKGKLDLAQAEAVNDLIASQTRSAHRAALSQVEGSLSKQVAGLKGKLVNLLARLEARLDDSYGDMPPFGVRQFLAKANSVTAEIRKLSNGFENGRRVKEGIKVAIAGAPNSGKSSLLNAILGYPRAIVSPAAGTTRDTVEAGLEIDGFEVNFTDTAGLKVRTPDSIERQGINRTMAAMGTADIILLVKDASIAQSPMDRLALETALKNTGGKTARLIRILNKSDLLTGKVKKIKKGGLVVSCKTGLGLSGVKRAIISGEKKYFTARTTALVTSARHFEALSLAAGELEKLRGLKRRPAFPLELAAEHIRGAASRLSSILGETAPDEILADIFKNFCVGK
ncbi:MAG: tRNA uridine-5-carboxymethylaminomethyl(34) synthesis GTPase MnmE [Elusimicrobia bacterium GWC2_51_8]|nr:MAG: tRNA uridine-5-carboxymethylaminomethyl(34) synthesis GTPase MnmE [Elusimicrobia bacterium GWA2_51_34]OGR59013.1 MAG: tRNA uridine-5-carboxymethylaminomethyl(34) synthesis GTPase MnmE [Elusimicrobia bacterium GWC2_51_8]OGR86069.1 MAG: tRNA uridine-5-carboxymethylaminomethyl(34) synthesis GTPase MnmE [Elusimicrobia bacterium GWF2_52_66]